MTQIWTGWTLDNPPVEGAFLTERGWEIHLAGTPADSGLTEVLVAIGEGNVRAGASGIINITAPSAGYYVDAEVLSFIVYFNEKVEVTGTPRLTLNIGGSTKYANYASGDGTNALTFSYTVEDGLLDTNGIVVSNNIDLNSGTIEDSDGEDTAVVTFTAADLLDTTEVFVDSLARTIATVSAVAANYDTDDSLDISVEFNAPVLVDVTEGTPSIPLFENDGTTPIGDAVYVSGSGTDTLVFSYVVQAGDAEATAVEAGANITLNDGLITDLANSANATVTFAQTTLTGVTLNQP